MTAPDHTLDAALVRLEALLGAVPGPLRLRYESVDGANAQTYDQWHAHDGKVQVMTFDRLSEATAVIAWVNAADAFVALAKAAQERAYDGHSEMCQMMFPRVWAACGCGHDDLVAALAGLAKVLPC